MTERRVPYTANPTCEVRDQCYVPIVRDGMQLEVPRSTLNIFCGFEICKTLELCPKRRALMQGSGKLDVPTAILKEERGARER